MNTNELIMHGNDIIIKLLDNYERNRQEEDFIKLSAELVKINHLLGNTGVNDDSCQNIIRYLDEPLQNLLKTVNIFINWYKEKNPEGFKEIYG